VCYVAIHPNTLAVTVITDPEYPQRVAFTLIADMFRQFQALGVDWMSVRVDANLPFPELATQLQRYQNPTEADRLTKIQSELSQVTDVMHRNIEELMKRGETLESLMARSEDLSGVSYDFYKRAKKNNQCCKLY
jgi:synaptobrevin family protein YKT6